jgi:hypothetical protein
MLAATLGRLGQIAETGIRRNCFRSGSAPRRPTARLTVGESTRRAQAGSLLCLLHRRPKLVPGGLDESIRGVHPPWQSLPDQVVACGGVEEPVGLRPAWSFSSQNC